MKIKQDEIFKNEYEKGATNLHKKGGRGQKLLYTTLYYLKLLFFAFLCFSLK